MDIIFPGLFLFVCGYLAGMSFERAKPSKNYCVRCLMDMK